MRIHADRDPPFHCVSQATPSLENQYRDVRCVYLPDNMIYDLQYYEVINVVIDVSTTPQSNNSVSSLQEVPTHPSSVKGKCKCPPGQRKVPEEVTTS